MPPSVAWISYTPVKGLALVQAAAVELTERGVADDRRFHVIDARGRLTNGKRLGVLQQVQPEWDEASSRLALRFPDGAVVSDEVVLGDENVTIFYGRPVRGHLVEGPWNEALSALAGEPLRLVQPSRAGDGIDRGRGGAVSLLSRASLEPLREAAGLDAGATVDERRFRMLFGVDGVAAHAEDGWIGREVRIGEAVVVPRGNVGRCLITSRDPDTGRPDMDTLGALRAYRGDVESTEPLPFGVFGEVRVPGRVALGDSVSP